MPRNHHPGASTLRNRIRITNKTRLRIHHGNLDADALLIPDEDEEKHRLTNLVAGVDAEDANEHHLQAVLTAATQHRPGGLKGDKAGETAPAAYIPTPGSTGFVANYEELYPPNRWKEPANYICASSTVEESCRDALAGGFTYYIDERDKEWLDKSNEEARGEGTSAQGAVSTSGTRTSARSAKAKGKEPDVSQPVVISEDEFELVMGLFEKVTHEKTEFLHHSLEGMAFPAFSEYQDTFMNSLPPSSFASYVIPSWLPHSNQLVRIARTIYPYWKDRRIERGGRRIIPTLNFDESDTLNESYICFRRREIKAVRKTRASQATSSDKLVRLQTELTYPFELAKLILGRENFKKDFAQQSQSVWENRLGIVDLKRKHPSLGDKGDEEYLVDKEKPKKLESTAKPVKIKATDSAPARAEIAMRPRDRTARIKEQVEAILSKQKEADHHWEDAIDNPYQSPAVPYPSRLFKFISPPPTSESEGEASVQPRAIRLRRGRGGRLLVDRRTIPSRPIVPMKRSSLVDADADSDESDNREAEERRRCMMERWRFDADDSPPTGPSGSDEQDRMLIDDFDSKYLRHTMTLLTEVDQQGLITDPTIPIQGTDGRQQMVLPYKLGMPQVIPRKDASGLVRHYIGGLPIPAPQQPGAPHPNGVVQSHGTPVAVAQQVQKIPPQAGLQLRILSNGGMRPPPQVAQSVQGNGHISPPIAALPQHTPATGNNNGVHRAAINLPHVDNGKPPEVPSATIFNGAVQISQTSLSDGNQAQEVKSGTTSPLKQAQHLSIPNGYHLAALNGYAAAALANATPYAAQHQGGLSLQQVQNLKSAFANMTPGQADLANVARVLPPSYLPVIPGAANFNLQQLTAVNGNMNIKLPPGARPIQWPSGGSPPQTKANGIVNGLNGGVDGQQQQQQVVNGSMSPPNQNANAVPARSPSANGMRPGMRMGPNGQLVAHSMSPHLQQSPSPIPAAIAKSQSPPRMPLTPTLTRASPSLQHQQPAGSSKSGY